MSCDLDGGGFRHCMNLVFYESGVVKIRCVNQMLCASGIQLTQHLIV